VTIIVHIQPLADIWNKASISSKNLIKMTHISDNRSCSFKQSVYWQ